MTKIYPTGLYHVGGVPAEEQDVPAEEAKRLLAFYPPAFTKTPPGEPEPDEAPQDEGPSDSRENE